MHRYIRDVVTLSLNENKCTGCGTCSIVCPHRILVMENGKAHIRDKDRCIECGACAKNCPFKAITVNAGVG